MKGSGDGTSAQCTTTSCEDEVPGLVIPNLLRLGGWHASWTCGNAGECVTFVSLSTCK